MHPAYAVLTKENMLQGLSAPIHPGALKNGLHYLVPLAVLLYELDILRHSPELAAFRAIMVLFVVIFYQEIRASVLQNSGAASMDAKKA